MASDPFLDSYEWRTVRMRVLERDGAKCACCGATRNSGVRLNVDHIKPRRRYPELALTESNLQVLCEACNHGKGNWSERDWRSPPSLSVPVPASGPVPASASGLRRWLRDGPEEISRLAQIELVRAAARRK